MDNFQEIIREMIEELQPYADFDETTSLLDEDVLDSVSVLVLVQEIEERFEMEIAAEEITAQNFKDMRSIIAMIKESGKKGR